MGEEPNLDAGEERKRAQGLGVRPSATGSDENTAKKETAAMARGQRDEEGKEKRA